MTRLATMLRVLIGVRLVWTFLLTPLALEPRPFSVINPIGYLSLALIFTTVALDIAAFVLVGRNPRTAATLAAIGPFLFVGPFLGDLAGLFAHLPDGQRARMAVRAQPLIFCDQPPSVLDRCGVDQPIGRVAREG